MKKENFVIGLIGVAVVFFLLGRFSVSTTEKRKKADSSDEIAKAQTDADETAADETGTAAAANAQEAPAKAEGARGAAPRGNPAANLKPAALEKRPTPKVAPNRPAAARKVAGSLNVVASPRKGAEVAKVTIMEISDFQWPFCSRVGPTLKQIIETWPNEVAVVFKHNPLGFHKQAMPAALASMAAAKQGKFWEYHDKMFADQKGINAGNLTKWATELGLDMAAFAKDSKDGALRKQIENEQRASVALGQRGTPAFLINGKALSGAQPFAGFKTIIEAELKAADEAIASGTPLAAVHAARARANLGGKAKLYMNSLVNGKPAKKPRPPVDPTVWKVTVDDHNPIKGNKDALVTIVEWSDYQWGYCSKVGSTLKKILQNFPNDVRVVMKHNALAFHNRAMPAAEAAMAAHAQGKFWEMHDAIFAKMRELTDEGLEKRAQEVGLDMGAFKKAMSSHKYKGQIEADMALAEKVRSRGTPSFYVNGRNIRGAQPYENFEALIKEELAKAQKVCAGMGGDQCYAERIIAKGKVFEPLEAKVNTFTTDGRPFEGNPKGDIIITEFSDFQWPYCIRVGPPLKQLTKSQNPALKGRVKLVFKHFPLGFHKQAMNAAKASIAAHRQGKFWEMHDVIFKNQKTLADDSYEKFAKEIGLKVAKFKKDFADPATDAEVKQDMSEARAAGVNGTPNVYINGRKYQGGYSEQQIGGIVSKYLK